VLLTGAFSIGMFAIPASMLTWGFEAEAARIARRARQLSKRQNSGAWSSTDEYSTDEDYQRIIAGEGSDESDDDDVRNETMTNFVQVSRRISVLESTVKEIGAGGNSEIEARLVAVESKVDMIIEQLDRICKMMEAS
jgi:hypothetical protein